MSVAAQLGPMPCGQFIPVICIRKKTFEFEFEIVPFSDKEEVVLILFTWNRVEKVIHNFDESFWKQEAYKMMYQG
jgi:hypothetical protein